MSVADQTRTMPLSAVHCGASARIVRLLLTGPERRRILDLGFVPGTVIECAFASPLGDPRAYRVRGSTTSLRRTQADQIVVEPCSGEADAARREPRPPGGSATAEVESDDA